MEMTSRELQWVASESKQGGTAVELTLVYFSLHKKKKETVILLRKNQQGNNFRDHSFLSFQNALGLSLSNTTQAFSFCLIVN